VDDATFDDLFAEATRASGRFGHREHVHLTWLAVRRLGADAAASLVGDGIRHTARYAGVPQKYNVTMSLAWARAVAFHVGERPDLEDFDRFAEAFPGLLDKRLLGSHYRSSTLAGADARTTWVEPDLRPFPWAAG
jgi:hypothetical protein